MTCKHCILRVVTVKCCSLVECVCSLLYDPGACSSHKGDAHSVFHSILTLFFIWTYPGKNVLNWLSPFPRQKHFSYVWEENLLKVFEDCCLNSICMAHFCCSGFGRSVLMAVLFSLPCLWHSVFETGRDNNTVPCGFFYATVCECTVEMSGMQSNVVTH